MKHHSDAYRANVPTVMSNVTVLRSDEGEPTAVRCVANGTDRIAASRRTVLRHPGESSNALWDRVLDVITALKRKHGARNCILLVCLHGGHGNAAQETLQDRRFNLRMSLWHDYDHPKTVVSEFH